MDAGRVAQQESRDSNRTVNKDRQVPRNPISTDGQVGLVGQESPRLQNCVESYPQSASPAAEQRQEMEAGKGQPDTDTESESEWSSAEKGETGLPQEQPMMSNERASRLRAHLAVYDAETQPQTSGIY